MSATERIADFIVSTDYGRVPAQAIKVAKQAILDCVGVALAGSCSSTGRIITEYVREIGGRAEAGVIGGGFKTSTPNAALANGTMAHALDYDDYHLSYIGHASVPLVPVVLALGEAGRLSGKKALEAYILGYEVEARIGVEIAARLIARGWHPTAVWGTMGAAAAASRLLGLDARQTRMALGIAGSQAGGLRENFGTDTKPLHPGKAASSGITAAMLARKGFTASQAIFDSPIGFFQVLAGEGKYDLGRLTQSLGHSFLLAEPGLAIKPYPSCGETHSSIEAILHLIREHHPAAEEVAEVECQLSQPASKILAYHQPRTALEGKFSMEYCLAAALLDGEVSLKQFTDEKVLEPRAQQLMEKVKRVHPDVKGEEWTEEALRTQAVTVKLRDGTCYSYQVSVPKGSPENPLTPEELAAKYRDCAHLALSPEATERSLELLSRLDELEDITRLMKLLTT